MNRQISIQIVTIRKIHTHTHAYVYCDVMFEIYNNARFVERFFSHFFLTDG